MLRFFQVYSAFFKQQIKSLIEYKIDFMMGMIALAVQQVATFLVIFLVFTQIEVIASYSFDEILLFYGYSQIIRGIDHILNDNIWAIGWEKIRNGEFSKYLIRPINPIVHIVMERVQFDGFGEVILGIIIFVYAQLKLGLKFSLLDSFIFLIFIITGLTIYFSIKLVCAAIAFWTVSSGELMSVVYEINGFTKYPLDIYKNVILKNILLYILPFALVSYIPIVYFIRDIEHISLVIGISLASKVYLLILTILITIITFLISLSFWNLGIKKYNATGT